MPRTPFVKLFTSWPENKDLNFDQLRMKTLTLMALCLMLRLSDVAPRAVVINNKTQQTVQFSADRIKYLEDGSVSIYFFGIKNDYNREGFRTYLMRSSDVCICPVEVLKHLLE